jgi:hypothetical protein
MNISSRTVIRHGHHWFFEWLTHIKRCHAGWYGQEGKHWSSRACARLLPWPLLPMNTHLITAAVQHQARGDGMVPITLQL